MRPYALRLAEQIQATYANPDSLPRLAALELINLHNLLESYVYNYNSLENGNNKNKQSSENSSS